MRIFLYGPPGSGKTTLGKRLSGALDLPFIDLDVRIEQESGKTIPHVFAEEGEHGFRQREMAALVSLLDQPEAVIALGGGALLNPEARRLAESSGKVLCLQASLGTLLDRLGEDDTDRPLLNGNPVERLAGLMAIREAHYHSFENLVDTNNCSPEEVAWQAQLCAGAFRVKAMGSPYDIRVESGGLERLGEHLLKRGLHGPLALVTDSNVNRLHADRVEASLTLAGYSVHRFVLAAGEASKTIQSTIDLWNWLTRTGLERRSTVVALGGGVVGDLTGFSAATYLRGVNWVNLPTTLLAMVDSSLGGKTGIDLPQAKNMVGAFYPPKLVLADPDVLASLPARELRGGLSETLKHGIISDQGLFEFCERGIEAIQPGLNWLVIRGLAVKVRVIETDPYEKGFRQALNLGHTVGHGVELASDYQLSHGEAVAIGMVVETRLAERIGVAEPGTTDRISTSLSRLGLPTQVPGHLSRERIFEAMQHDKKRKAGTIQFALPVRIGETRVGVQVDNWQEELADLLFSGGG